MALPKPSRRCMPPPSIPKVTVVAMFEDTTTGDWLAALDDTSWSVVSFEPQTRLVCLDVITDHGRVNHVNLTLPVLSLSKLK